MQNTTWQVVFLSDFGSLVKRVGKSATWRVLDLPSTQKDPWSRYVFPEIYQKNRQKCGFLSTTLDLKKKNKLLYRGHVDLLSVFSMALAQPKLGFSNRNHARKPGVRRVVVHDGFLY